MKSKALFNPKLFFYLLRTYLPFALLHFAALFLTNALPDIVYRYTPVMYYPLNAVSIAFLIMMPVILFSGLNSKKGWIFSTLCRLREKACL